MMYGPEANDVACAVNLVQKTVTTTDLGRILHISAPPAPYCREPISGHYVLGLQSQVSWSFFLSVL
jgi:hypothetical protein